MHLDLIISCRSTVTEWELNNILLITSRVNRRNGHKNSLSKWSPGITAEDTQESISSVPHIRTYMTNLLAFRARKKHISPENCRKHFLSPQNENYIVHSDLGGAGGEILASQRNRWLGPFCPAPGSMTYLAQSSWWLPAVALPHWLYSFNRGRI